ncbi:hypothetical protein A5792_26680 [Mycolicibacterium peregrinum]|uniref:Uncharacterized protein n=1 Tax=Mycolicibacterium peregrinum TaxID=43304 RepID=A0A1A0QWX7_MYCPR|nr:hypothetical protein [Mycolicibacterium peregrinum]OBB26612.1 hypothetical protein A5792_26680 [Mycolicibacterium peregrinum]
MAAADKSAHDADLLDTLSQRVVMGVGAVETKCVRLQSGQGARRQAGRVDRSDELGVQTSIR